MIKFADVFLNAASNNTDKLYEQLEEISDNEYSKDLYFVDYFPKQQSEKEFLDKEIFFELIEDGKIDSFKYFELLYKYKTFINSYFSNCSIIVTNLDDIDQKSIIDIIGVSSKHFLDAAKKITTFIPCPYTERILDLSFADRIETILISDRHKCILFVCGFSCAIYIYDPAEKVKIESSLNKHGLFLWKKNI